MHGISASIRNLFCLIFISIFHVGVIKVIKMVARALWRSGYLRFCRGRRVSDLHNTRVTFLLTSTKLQMIRV